MRCKPGKGISVASQSTHGSGGIRRGTRNKVLHNHQRWRPVRIGRPSNK
jgi:hypothetical protein